MPKCEGVNQDGYAGGENALSTKIRSLNPAWKLARCLGFIHGFGI